MKNNTRTDCLKYPNYPAFLIGKIKNEGVVSKALKIYGKLKKFTVVSAVIRTAAFVVALLEKSAILLLIFSYFVLLIPACAVIMLLVSGLSVAKYLFYHRKIREWVRNADKITVFLTSEKIFSGKRPLFLREAETEASGYDHPVIVLCSDRFGSLRWYSFNLLAIKTDYFFVLRRFYFKERTQKIVFREIY